MSGAKPVGDGAAAPGRAAPRLVCVGVATLDRIYRVAAIPDRPVKVLAHACHETGGGMAATGAVCIARLGGRVDLWARVGDDAAGQRILADLRAEGVGTDAVAVHRGRASTHATVLVDAAGERLLVSYRDPDMPATADSLPTGALPTGALPTGALPTGALPTGALAAADAVLADSAWIEGALAAFRQARGPTVLDCDSVADPRIREVMALASHCLFAAPGLAAMTGTADPVAGLRHMVPGAGGLVGVTAGARGFFWREAGDRIHHLPPPPVSVVDTLGAGDVFHGAYALALAEGGDSAACARFASAAAALKCSRPGGRDGAPRRAELDRLLAGWPGSCHTV